MSIFDIFTPAKKKAKLSHLKNLVALSMADGKVKKTELAAIAAVCSREGISESKFKQCLECPSSIQFVPPKDDETRIKYLRDMVLLMMCDGKIDDNEMLVCKMTAEALGFKHEVIDAMLLDIIAEITLNRSM